MRQAVYVLLSVTCLALSAALVAQTPGSTGDGAQLPALLSQTGLYSSPGVVDPRNLNYSPQYPLWTDGAHKSRWIFLPPGSAIDATNMDAWQFPVGTRLWKEFSFGGRKVETRMLWRATTAGWRYATYLWNGDQSDAALAPQEGVSEYFEVAPGKRHSIPAISDCKNCHENETSGVLGFTALQLSTDRDPLAPHAEPLKPGMITLRTLVERRLLAPSSEDLVSHPPRIPSENPRIRAVLGYLSANCGNCHTGGSSIGGLGLGFAHRSTAKTGEMELGFATTVGQPSKWQIPYAPEGKTRRIEPGSPELSAVLYRMSTRNPTFQMPPLGTVVVDQEAVDLLKQWITLDLPAATAHK